MDPRLESEVRVFAASVATLIPDGPDAEKNRLAWEDWTRTFIADVVQRAERVAWAEGYGAPEATRLGPSAL